MEEIRDRNEKAFDWVSYKQGMQNEFINSPIIKHLQEDFEDVPQAIG